jgi:endoglucanase
LPAASGPSTRAISIMLPVGKMRGAQIDFRARVRAENVAVPPQVYNGVKFMLVVEGPSGKQYPSHDHLWGNFDWTVEHFRATVPPDATKATLVLGLEATDGKAEFSDVTVSVHARAFAGGPVSPGLAYTGHSDIPHLRGAMVSPDVTPADLHVLGGEWHANLIRYQLYWVTPKGRYDGWRDSVAYDAWLEGRLQHLDALLPICRQEGLRVVVDLHSPPGGNISLPGYAWPLFQEKAYQDKFLRVWDKLARRYKNNSTVWGYDLANEPIEGDVTDGLLDWHTLATKAAQIVRHIDPTHAIIVEPGPGGSYDQLPYFAPLPVSGVVYSVHMYEPGAYTMQGVTPDQPLGVHYPGNIGGAAWDRAQMAHSLQVVADYQKHYHVAIYIGEFSAIRWAPGAVDWLRDAISIFEKNGWDWSYHAFREWQGWSVEYGSDKDAIAPSVTPTDRELLLRLWYAKNIKAHP